MPSVERSAPPLVIRAVRTCQGDGVDVYAFFLRGTDVLRVADIVRIRRDADSALVGFQRDEIKSHVNGIVEFLNRGTVLFPNAIILALSPAVHFASSRGPSPLGLVDIAQSGTLTIPVLEEGGRAAWIVDGQQRSLALARTMNKEIVVPIVGFVSSDIEVHREQFILVNKAKPLPSRLIDELLPATTGTFPRDLAVKKVPSEICNLLNQRPASPFHRLIRRKSDRESVGRVIIDTAIVKMIRTSMNSPTGALMPYKGGVAESPDVEAIYRTLCLFWGVVKDTFPEAWGRPPTESRLMHSAGVEAMGHLMDRIMTRAVGADDPESAVRQALARIAPHCSWTEGVWGGLNVAWNEVQSTPRDIKSLTDQLARLDFEMTRRL